MPRMQLYRATALIAVVLIVVLSAGYAAAERERELPRTSFEKSGQ